MVITLYPFIYMLAVSFSDELFIMQGKITWYPKGFTLDSYKAVLSDPRIGIGFKNSTIYTALSTAAMLIVTSLGAYALSKRDMPLRKPFTLMIVFTMFFSGGMIPSFLVMKAYHLINTIWIMVLPSLAGAWNIFVMRTFFQGIPVELEESAKVDGLNDIGVFFRIVLPMSGAIFAAIGLFHAVGVWNNFTTPLIYIRDNNLMPLSVILRNILIAGMVNTDSATGGVSGSDEGVVEEAIKYTTIMVATIPILVVYPFLQKYFVKGVWIGSVKG